MKGDLHSVHILRRGGASEAVKDKLGRIPSDLQPEGVGRGFDSDAEIYPPGNDIDEQVPLGGQVNAPGLDDDNNSGHGRSDSEDSASDAKDPADIAVDSLVDGDEGGSGGGSGQIAPGCKEPGTKHGPRILLNPLSDTSISSVSRNLREVALNLVNSLARGIYPTRDSDDGSGSNTMTTK